MVKFRFSLSLLFFLLFLPLASGEVEINLSAETITYGAPGNAFVDSGENITFNATGIIDAKSVLWDFGRDISGNGTRYSNVTSVSHIVYAEGRYDIFLTVFYEDETYEISEFTLFVDFEEDLQNEIIHNEALFFAIAGSELIMSAILGYWTQQIRKEKVYL